MSDLFLHTLPLESLASTAGVDVDPASDIGPLMENLTLSAMTNTEYRAPVLAPAARPLSKRDEWAEQIEITPAGDADILSKSASHRRRVEAYKDFLKTRLALGDTAEQVIAHAERHDLATANVLREAAAEL